MRKFLSLTISLIIAFMSVADGVIAFANMPKDNGLTSFAENLSQMIRENDSKLNFDSVKPNDNIFEAESFYSNSNSKNYDYENLPDDAFLTKRLIVKSDKKIDYQGAVDCVSGYNDLYILQYATESDAQSAYAYYLNYESVEYVEPDLIAKATIDDIPGEELPDEEAGYLDEVRAAALEWLLDKIGFSDIKEELAERIQDDYVLVAVIDSGVDTDHELLEGRLEENNVNFSSSGERNSVEDDYGHGTHVAGILANNTLDNVKIKPYKVLNEEGKGSLSSIAVAIDMAVQEGADIVNLSLSADGESQVMTDAVNNAVANDVNVVVAAGNSSKDLDKRYICPACIESAITVSATDKNDELASFSNYDGTIDIAAPGTDIESSYLDNKYLSLSGTSMAAPQVSAGLALLQSISKDELASKCEEIIKEYAIKKSENEGENHFGAGILFLKYLLDGKPTTADPVFSVDSCNFSTAFDVSITCPDDDATIYCVVYDIGGLDEINFLEGFEYTSPITISMDSKVSAIAIGKGMKPSSIVTVEYDRVVDSEEDNYDINLLGYITAYYGSETDLVIPEKIKGRTVRGIAADTFENNKKIKSVILPNSVEIIKSKAFSGCSNLVSVIGNNVEEIGTSAFENSIISEVSFRNVEKIDSSAFAGCKNLVEINLDNTEELGDSVFSGSGLIEAYLPNVTSIGMNVFNGCENLESATLPLLEKISIGTFRNCTSLESVDISSATEIAANAFRNTIIESIEAEKVLTVGNYAFADNPNLQKARFVNLQTTGAYIFQNCSSLKLVSLRSLETVNSYTFSNCTSLKNVYLPLATKVEKNGFANSSIEILNFECVETIKHLPNTLKALIVPSSLSSVTGTVPSTDFVVYGFEGTYAEQFATDKNKEFCPVPAIAYELNDQFNAEDGYIVAFALGFNCEYQWYKNDKLSNENGTPIEDANNYYYQPVREDNAVAYYCVITSTDGINTNTITTKVVENAPEYRDADYSEYYNLYNQYQQIDKSLYVDDAFNEVENFFSIDVRDFSLAEQDLLNENIEKIKNIIASAKLKYILCDINADGKISIIDARLALKAVVGSYLLNGTQTLAADVNEDGKVSIADSRSILKSVLDQ